jgi:hypothetical protein
LAWMSSVKFSMRFSFLGDSVSSDYLISPYCHGPLDLVKSLVKGAGLALLI